MCSQPIATRNPYPFVFGVAVAAVFPLVWTANYFGYAQVDGGDSIWATLFVWLFAFPVAVWSVYSCWIATPYIVLAGRELRLCSMTTPWKTTTIATDEILEISTFWLPGTTRCMIAFRLSANSYRATAGDWAWAKRGNGWVYFHMLHSAIDPHVAAKRISDATGIAYTLEKFE